MQHLPARSVVAVGSVAVVVAIELELPEEVADTYRMVVRTLKVDSEEDHVRGH